MAKSLRIRFTRLFVISSILTLVIMLLRAIGLIPYEVSPRPLRIGCEKQGVNIRLVNIHGFILPMPGRIDVVNHGWMFVLDSLNQLRGLVSIQDPQSALRFVRFRTAPDLIFYWPGPKEEEIIDQAHAGDLPLFLQADKPYTPTGLGSGDSGILSKTAYSLGGFTPPKLEPINNGFEIIRWIHTERKIDVKAKLNEYSKKYGINQAARRAGGERQVVQRIREVVGTDGSYQRTILETKQAPTLPNTKWTFAYQR